jgi:hypothetical protein
MRRHTAAFFLVALLGAPTANAQPMPVPTAEDVEAAYLQKFVGYVDWPASAFDGPDSPIVIGVVGSDHVYDLLVSAAKTRTVGGRRVDVRRLDKPSQSSSAHLIFVGRDAWNSLEAWTGSAKGHPVVVATDAARGCERGAALAFVMADQRIRFDASPAAAESSGVKLSARLLAVAERVVGPVP